MDRYFSIDCCVYDRDNYKIRVAYGSAGTAQSVRDTLNNNPERHENIPWCGSEHLEAHGPWAPTKEFEAEYDQAVRVLGIEYFYG